MATCRRRATAVHPARTCAAAWPCSEIRRGRRLAHPSLLQGADCYRDQLAGRLSQGRTRRVMSWFAARHTAVRRDLRSGGHARRWRGDEAHGVTPALRKDRLAVGSSAAGSAGSATLPAQRCASREGHANASQFRASGHQAGDRRRACRARPADLPSLADHHPGPGPRPCRAGGAAAASAAPFLLGRANRESATASLTDVLGGEMNTPPGTDTPINSTGKLLVTTGPLPAGIYYVTATAELNLDPNDVNGQCWIGTGSSHQEPGTSGQRGLSRSSRTPASRPSASSPLEDRRSTG